MSDDEMDEEDGGELADSLHDDVRQMGVLACVIGLARETNPFPRDSVLCDCWDAGYDDAIIDWRAEQRAMIADDYGDEAADYF